ncbi:type II toxin-antitoxin system RelE/ParE family toxin [Dolichospermum circinale CS-1225]|uniref:Type II toxin-antitoxin system RelE/ParE family toxin n=1 Tax=Dolichospermum circinale CS-537/01 TaxID=3021739 RepID=A0ABT4ZZE5_9CYAN|nr:MULTISPECIES: type II toxin-antitoxin system RelE/ParE family toxin [Nostocales]MBD1214961.1 type II toxin-antitoxin system RelE/ParE family toxin [Dolichospermum circinale Clear-D4]MBD2443367.1 type II toxin-antitoxin system RelE/ParE family toxin [Dolichospermum sp. FACHB-1091]MCE2719962.1 type II toxin-antitoxin system RelE/ParE family toxin [Anabaena sp. 49628_E55]MDB9460049.1 type II toxin-antitoxin system RelE/ParE family toxin [Dolichospermum circinale CS-545/17]OBQ33209.1 MAG: plasm
MHYQIEFKPKAIKDLQKIPVNDRERIINKIEAMQDDLQGDVKRLTNFTPEYRLRVGDYRILFELAEQTIIVYRVKHRSKAYE